MARMKKEPPKNVSDRISVRIIEQIWGPGHGRNAEQLDYRLDESGKRIRDNVEEHIREELGSEPVQQPAAPQ